MVEQFILGAKLGFQVASLGTEYGHKMGLPFFHIGNELWRAAWIRQFEVMGFVQAVFL